MSCSIPASRASSTAYWMSGRSTTVIISFGIVFVAGSRRVPRPATGNTALRTGLAIWGSVSGLDGSAAGSRRAGLITRRLLVGSRRKRLGCTAGRRWQVERIRLPRLRLADEFVDAIGLGVGRQLEQLLRRRLFARHQRLDRKWFSRGGLQVRFAAAAAYGNASNKQKNDPRLHRARTSCSPQLALAPCTYANYAHLRRAGRARRVPKAWTAEHGRQ